MSKKERKMYYTEFVEGLQKGIKERNAEITRLRECVSQLVSDAMDLATDVAEHDPDFPAQMADAIKQVFIDTGLIEDDSEEIQKDY